MWSAEREAQLDAEQHGMTLRRHRSLRIAGEADRPDLSDPASGFAVAVMSGPARTVVRPVGDLDLGTADQLETSLNDVLARGSSELVLDLRRLDFCDAAGLQVFVRTRRRAAGLGTRLWIERPARTVRRVLEISGLDWLIQDGTGDA
jgi:anti-anti-sigma factor